MSENLQTGDSAVPPEKEGETKTAEQINNLKEILEILDSPEIIDEEYPRLNSNIPHYLAEAGRKDLAVEAMKVLLNDNLRLVLSKEEDEYEQFRKINHAPHQAAIRYMHTFGREGIEDKRYNKLGRDLLKVVAARFEGEERYNHALEVYEVLGMENKVTEMQSKLPVSREDRNEDLTIFNNAVKEIQDEYKDFVFMFEKERNQILENIKKEINLQIQSMT